MEKLNIIVVDNHSTFRHGISFYLEEMLHHKVIAQYSDGVEFLQSKNITKANIVLMDIQMPVMDGFDTAKKALWQYPELKIIAITSYYHNTYLKELIYSGFKGCILKDQVFEDLNKAFSMILNDKTFFTKNFKLEPDSK